MREADSLGACGGTSGERFSEAGVTDYLFSAEDYGLSRTVDRFHERIADRIADGIYTGYLLDCRFSLGGIGVAADASGMLWICSFYLALDG